MAVRPIVITGEPVLHRPAARVEAFDDALRSLVADMYETMDAAHGVGLAVDQQSTTAAVTFDEPLRRRITDTLGGAPSLPTGAGHDAGVLAAYVPTAMLFVRNPTGVSHSPAEHATDEDCEAGVDALTAVLADLSG